MILTAHQPSYLPWPGLFHKIYLSDTFVFLDTVQYQKKEFDNRNYIISGKSLIQLSVPTLSKNHFEIINKDIKINDQINWRYKHLKSIYLNYKNKKYFDKYFNEIKRIILDLSYTKLSEINYQILLLIVKFLKINTKVLKSSNYNFTGSKSNLVLDMCKKLNAKKFIFGAQGINYADSETFMKNEIEIKFQNFNFPKYKKIISEMDYFPSIIDLIFEFGPKSMDYILDNNAKSFDEL